MGLHTLPRCRPLLPVRPQTTNMLLDCGELALLTPTQNIPKLAPLRCVCACPEAMAGAWVPP